MKISQIYQRYPITPTLALHMIRAAAVGAYIADHWKNLHPISKHEIITMLLLHDTANIVKFDLEKFPHLLGDELPRIKFWQDQQIQFIKHYGEDEHHATQRIAQEVGIQGRAMDLLNNMGSRLIQQIAKSDDFEQKLCMYGDLRVGPFGILSVDERFDDIIARYQGRQHELADIKKTEEKRKWCLIIEEQLQKEVTIPLKKISDETIKDYVLQLSEYDLSSSL